MVAYQSAPAAPPHRRERGRDFAGPVRHVLAHLTVAAPPDVEGRPWWPPVATEAWLRQALRCGIAAADCTAEVIDWLRDSDDGYGGSVRIGWEIFDLLVDGGGCVRVAGEDRYLQ